MVRTEEIQVNMGPQHPSTHGILRMILTLDGETVVDARPDIGYLHRGIEKLAENRNYIQFVTLTDRTDYLSSMMNNAVYSIAVEKLAGIEVPERAEFIRVIMMELNRIASHLVFIGAFGLDLGASTPFIYAFREREDIIDLFEMACGARLTYSYIRPGGVMRDLPAGFDQKARDFLKKMPSRMEEIDDLFSKNEIVIVRARGVGVISAEDAINYGMSGPNLRGSGVAFDLRKDEPYSVYNRLNFNVVTQSTCDCLGRYLVRTAEIRESLKIVEQALDVLPEGEHTAQAPRALKPPPGEVFVRIESSRGDLGVYLVSDGSTNPYRLHWRPPSFINIAAVGQMVKGWKVADTVAVLGSLDIVLGEIDR
ncbi:MAG TPA: NADH-quinone oxidoreductase subunit D [Armatimonadota bacterium]|nr:NADH-quinone oxidoreductase subunit D [Armatimonadota bacterium]